MKYYLLALLLVAGSAFADYSKEEAKLRKFEKEEFLNEKNYSKPKEGALPDLSKAFYDKLMSDPAALKYFTVLSVQYRVKNRYKNIKPFALSLESKFKGSKLKEADMTKVMNKVRDIVMAEPESMHKKAFLNAATFKEYYDSVLKKINETSFN